MIFQPFRRGRHTECACYRKRVRARYDLPTVSTVVTFIVVGAYPMARHHVWNFHNPRLSIAQSAIRAVISHSLTGTNGPALMQSRVAAWSKGAISSHVVAMPKVGVCAGCTTMAALGTVLKQIDQKKITDADQACAGLSRRAVSSARDTLGASAGNTHRLGRRHRGGHRVVGPWKGLHGPGGPVSAGVGIQRSVARKPD